MAAQLALEERIEGAGATFQKLQEHTVAHSATRSRSRPSRSPAKDVKIRTSSPRCFLVVYSFSLQDDGMGSHYIRCA
jgi:hypothetical protein